MAGYELKLAEVASYELIDYRKAQIQVVGYELRMDGWTSGKELERWLAIG
jgi:hypothetical protein